MQEMWLNTVIFREEIDGFLNHVWEVVESGNPVYQTVDRF